MGWGIVVSNSSERSKVEKVRLASSAGLESAAEILNYPQAHVTYSSGSEVRREVFAFLFSTELWVMRLHEVN